MSYRKKHIKNKIHRIKPKKSLFKKKWFWVLFLLIFILLVGAYFLLFYPGVQIENVFISGNEKVNGQDLSNLVTGSLEAALIDIAGVKLTTKSIFLVNGDKIKEEVLSDFSDIETASIKKILPQTIHVQVSERQPTGIYCLENSAEQPCFFIDRNGIVFKESLDRTDELIFIKKLPAPNSIDIGSLSVDSHIMNAISDIKINLKNNFNIGVKEALIANPIRLNITTSEGWEIYFDIDYNSDINSQLTKLNLLINTNINFEARKALEYIDLRFQDRVFYK